MFFFISSLFIFLSSSWAFVLVFLCFSFLWLSFCACLSSFSFPPVEFLCLFMNDGGVFIFLLGIWPWKTRVRRILCLCSSMVVWLLRFSLRKEAKMRKKNDTKKKKWMHMRGWSLGAYFLAWMTLHMNSLAQTNNILLITWGQTTQKEAFKFLIIGPKIFLALIPTLKWA